MAVPTYRFHCTDGHVAIIDPRGIAIAEPCQIHPCAADAARFAMERVGANLDWSDWIVDVHDSGGRRILVLPFRDVAVRSRAA